MEEPRVSRAGQQTQKAKAQSAVGEEWEVCKNKKQQITGIMRDPEDLEQWLSCVDSSKEWGKLRLIVQQETAGRRDVWMR